ncbi:MAG TPA: helix-turn-helix domain-containing protein [Ktedonosporobacter sp.]|nr:helix-turn-helix domain-containing protein [Ktedonosporobacter sp.]
MLNYKEKIAEAIAMAGIKATLLLHPLHLRIVDKIEGRQLTAQQLAAILPDIAQATLYRHLNQLVEGGILEIIEERPVRGTVEKVYAITEPISVELTREDLEQFTREDLIRYFTGHMMLQTTRFERYLQQEEIDIPNDGIRFYQIPLYLSNEEYQRLFAEVQKLLLTFAENQPAPGRRRRIASTVFIPDIETLES